MKKVISVFVVMVFVFAMASVAGAAEKSFKQAAKDAGRATVNYPANAVNETVNVVGKAAYGATETAISPLKAFWRNLIGKGKLREIVTDPINRGGETVRDVTVGTAKMPYEAGKKTVDQNK